MESTYADVTFDMSELEDKEYLEFMDDVEDVCSDHGVKVDGLWF